MTITIQKFKKFENKWVAMNQKTQEVVASGKNIALVQKKAEKTKEKNITLKFIIPFNSYIKSRS